LVCYNITLNVWEHNDTAKKFYESCGFGVQKYGLEVVL
jgi:ribosomal protein S18 acetylase RimI-like enzyme